MNVVHYTPIGLVHSPFTEISGMPIQPTAAQGVRGSVVLNSETAAGLRDIEGFSHLILIRWSTTHYPGTGTKTPISAAVGNSLNVAEFGFARGLLYPLSGQ